MKEAACYVKTGMTEHEKLKMMMADNKVYELGLTDLESIDEILKDLNGDFDIPGYDDHLLETITMSFQETDDFISSYGSFSEEDVANVRKNEEAPMGRFRVRIWLHLSRMLERQGRLLKLARRARKPEDTSSVRIAGNGYACEGDGEHLERSGCREAENPECVLQ